jgi:hypothetical protein
MIKKTNLSQGEIERQTEREKQMDDGERAECLIRLHEAQLKHQCQTRDIEFKVNLAIWTAIVLAGWFLYDKIALNDSVDRFYYSLLSIAIVFAHIFLWMAPIQFSADKDDHYINMYRKTVETLINTNIPDFNSEGHFGQRLQQFRKSGVLWIFFEVGITAILLAIVGVALSLE